MTGSAALLWIVTALYAAQACVSAWAAHSTGSGWPAVTILAGYTVANLGLIWSLR